MSAESIIKGEISPDPATKKFGAHLDALKFGLVSLLTDRSSEMII